MSVTTQAADYDIPDDSTWWDESQPKKLMHVMLTIVRKQDIDPVDPDDRTAHGRLKKKALVFGIVPVKDDTIGGAESDIVGYAKDYLANPPSGMLSNPKTPYDIGGIKGPTWLVVELDPEINWHFPVNKFGCTYKAPRVADEPSDDRFLRHVYRNGPEVVCDPRPLKDGCQLLFFGVARREAAGSSKHFDIHVEFLQEYPANTPLRRLPVIIDPDVPNSGSAGFPGGGGG